MKKFKNNENNKQKGTVGEHERRNHVHSLLLGIVCIENLRHISRLAGKTKSNGEEIGERPGATHSDNLG